MKPRHTAALALLGWYLMCPPVENSCWYGERTLHKLFSSAPSACEEKYPNLDTPFDKWEQAHAFDSADKCQYGMMDQDALMAKRLLNPSVAAYGYGCQCVASDDPRLKRK